MRHFLLPLFLAPALLLSACANPGVPESSALGYSTSGAQQMQSVQFGTVLAIQPVLIAPNTTGIGTLGGAAAGGYLGSRIGGGNGSVAAALIGAVAGGIAGSAAEGAATRQQGLQITIRLDEECINYFKSISEDVAIPYQSLINLYLRDCANSNRKLDLKWK